MQNVKQIASLAHLCITEEETGKLQEELDFVTGYVSQLDELDLDGVEATVHGQTSAGFFREDVPHVFFSQEQALANAPDRVGDEFKVPKMVE